MNENPKFTIDIVPVGDHLQVTIPEIGVTISTEPGQMKQEDAEKVALSAISRYQQSHYEAAQGLAS